jgi:choline dehydrogenase-like flavoprotein
METDLQRADASSGTFRAQVCIVGAGIAGLVLAKQLSKQGISVALLEAGGLSLEEHGQSEFAAATLKGQPHRGTAEGRFRVFGGSSLRWGGQLLPMPQDSAWPVSADELAPYAAEAEKLLGVDDLPFTGESFFARLQKRVPILLAGLKGVDVGISKWVPFSQRNLAETIGQALLGDPNVMVYLNAQATELLPDVSGSRIQAVMARNIDGSSFRFEADQFVVAAGTVETVRLLLASRSVSPEGVGNTHGQVGGNFHDHLTLPVATATGGARKRLLRELRPWIVRGTVHSIKLKADAALCERLGLNPVLAHITIEEPEDSGVALVRRLLLRKQRGGVRIGSVSAVLHAVTDAVRLVWYARVRGRRFVSSNARVQLTINGAQDAPALSRIALDEHTDANGIAKTLVEWLITENELVTLRKFTNHLKEQLGALDGMQWSTELEEGTVPKSMDDARHAMGGACMGIDPRSSVVDPDLFVHAIDNLSVASAAVFPDGSPQLPTLPLLALTLRLAERLATQLLR